MGWSGEEFRKSKLESGNIVEEDHDGQSAETKGKALLLWSFLEGDWDWCTATIPHLSG